MKYLLVLLALSFNGISQDFDKCQLEHNGDLFAILDFQEGVITQVLNASAMRPFIETISSQDRSWLAIDKESGKIRASRGTRSVSYGSDASAILKDIMENEYSVRDNGYEMECSEAVEESSDW